jgi:hypothetical protein
MIYDSGSAPRGSIFSPRETSPESTNPESITNHELATNPSDPSLSPSSAYDSCKIAQARFRPGRSGDSPANNLSSLFARKRKHDGATRGLALKPLPHGRVRPFHQKSTCLRQLTLGPYAMQTWSRNPQNVEATKPW